MHFGGYIPLFLETPRYPNIARLQPPDFPFSFCRFFLGSPFIRFRSPWARLSWDQNRGLALFNPSLVWWHPVFHQLLRTLFAKGHYPTSQHSLKVTARHAFDSPVQTQNIEIPKEFQGISDCGTSWGDLIRRREDKGTISSRSFTFDSVLSLFLLNVVYDNRMQQLNVGSCYFVYTLVLS